MPIKKKRSHKHRTSCILHQQLRFNKKKDPNINIVNDIHIIKGKTSVNILVTNYTNKHIMFNKGQYVGHLEPTIEKYLHFMLIQMPIPQTVLQSNE